MNWDSQSYECMSLVDARYFHPLFRWPDDGQWRKHFPFTNLAGSMSKEVEALLARGLLRVVQERGYDRAVLTNAGHRYLDTSSSVYALPEGLHQLPDDRLYDQPRLTTDGANPPLHKDFVVLVGGSRLLTSMTESTEIYIGIVPNYVEAGESIMLDTLGDNLGPGRRVMITRVFDGADRRHACGVELGRLHDRDITRDYAQLPAVINTVGIWHLDVKPMTELSSGAFTARVDWSADGWLLSVVRPDDTKHDHAFEYVDGPKLTKRLNELARVPVTVNDANGRWLVQGVDKAFAYHLYWLLRQDFSTTATYERLDWMFEPAIGQELGYPSPEAIQAKRERR